jgi:hypothetical protein
VRRNLSLASELAGSRGHLCIGQEFFNSCLNACRVGLESLFQLRNCLCGSGLAIICCWNIFRTLHFNAQRALEFGMTPTHRSWFESIHPHDMPPLPLCRHQLSPIAPRRHRSHSRKQQQYTTQIPDGRIRRRIFPLYRRPFPHLQIRSPCTANMQGYLRGRRALTYQRKS